MSGISNIADEQKSVVILFVKSGVRIGDVRMKLKESIGVGKKTCQLLYQFIHTD